MMSTINRGRGIKINKKYLLILFIYQYNISRSLIRQYSEPPLKEAF